MTFQIMRNGWISFRGKKYRSRDKVPLIEEVHALLQMLTGISDAELEMLIRNFKGSDRRRTLDLIERTKAHRLEILKRQNLWTLRNFNGRLHELRYLIDDFVDQLDAELQRRERFSGL